MAKGRKSSKNGPKTRRPPAVEEDFDDEIDHFHKERDVIALDGSDDMGDDDSDEELPVFDFKKDDIGSEEDEDDSDDDYDKTRPNSFAAKISRQQKFLRQKIGGVEDEMQHDLDEEEDEDDNAMWWGKKKDMYRGADVVDIEVRSSDEENLKEEEAAAIKMQKERALSLSVKDFGLMDTNEEDSDFSDQVEKDTFGISKSAKRRHNDMMEGESKFVAYEKIQKDFSAFKTEEKINAVYSVAPELVQLIPDLKDSLNQLECKVNPLIFQVKKLEDFPEELHSFLEMKKSILLIYCQAIGFYLLLMAEGRSVRDHPVIERLTKAKQMLVEMKALDDVLYVQIEEFVNKEREKVINTKNAKEFNVQALETDMADQGVALSSKLTTVETPELADLAKDMPSELRAEKNINIARQNNGSGIQSMEMLKVRARLEEKLRKKGFPVPASTKDEKTKKNTSLLANRQLQVVTDFNDEAIINDARKKNRSDGFHPSQLTRSSQLTRAKNKAISGDDDLPRRDDLGERRRKHELRVLAKAGLPINDAADSNEEFAEASNAANGFFKFDKDETEESEDEFYREAKRIKAEKILSKTELYSRQPTIAPSLLPEDVDGKRHITYQMQKNKGLTRNRKKQTKIPRKKYKLKHEKAVVRRKGQVREMRKPSGPYGGEVAGINANVSRSVRFKN